MHVLEINNLNVVFNKNSKQVLKNISLTINKGEVLSIVGGSGSGKSVTANSIMQFNRHKTTQSGTINFLENNLLTASTKLLRSIRGNKMSIVFQDAMDALNPLHKIENQVAEVITCHNDYNKHTIKTNIYELFDMLEIPSLKKRLASYPHELSGGQRQRVMLAIALANKPDLLIADEPTTALDTIAQSQILKLLLKLKHNLKMTMLFITHNIAIASKIADHICIMRNGEICEINTVENIYNNPQHKYSQKLLRATLKMHPVTIKHKDKILVSVEKISFPMQNKFHFLKKIQPIINNISLKIKKGKTIALIGESGCGKSTIAKAIIGMIKINGKVLLENEPINTKKARRKIQIVTQDNFGSFNPRMTVYEIITEGLDAHNLRKEKKERASWVAAKINDVSLTQDILNKYPHECSGGERQRIAIARALILMPQIIILDEPTSALDVLTERKIIKLLHSLQKNYFISYLFISHNISAVKSLSHEIAIMKDGAIIEFGLSHEIINNPEQIYSKTLLHNTL